jgi:hypothetical protein
MFGPIPDAGEKIARRDPELGVTAETCAAIYRREQPIMAMVRSWCAADVVQFDEMQALRAENARLREVMVAVLERLESPYSMGDRDRKCAYHLRHALGLEIPKRKHASRPWSPGIPGL